MSASWSGATTLVIGVLSIPMHRRTRDRARVVRAIAALFASALSFVAGSSGCPGTDTHRFSITAIVPGLRARVDGLSDLVRERRAAWLQQRPPVWRNVAVGVVGIVLGVIVPVIVAAGASGS